MATQAISWGEDAHRSVIESLSWPDNSRLACCNRALYNARITCTTNNSRPSWGQAQSISRDVEDLVASLVRAAEVLTPSARPNWSMLMIDSDVLLTTTTRDLCGRLQGASLIPFECPVFVVKSASGVFGAGVGEEGNFSRYEGRDIELNPTAPVTAVLTVAYIPPEEGVNGRPGRPRVQSFIVDDSPQNRQRHSSKSASDKIDPVLMECAPPTPAGSAFGCAAAAGKLSPEAAALLSRFGGSTSADACGGNGSDNGGSGSGGGGGGNGCGARGGGSGGGRGGGSAMKEPAESESAGAISRVAVPVMHQSGRGGGGGDSAHQQKSMESAEAAKGADGGGIAGGASDSGGAQPQPQRRSARLSTMANSRMAARSRAASPRVRPQLLPPSASVPLENADTFLIVGQQPLILANTTAWLELMLPKAVIIGGISGCALVIGNQVFPGDKLSRQPRRTHSPPLVVGVAMRGVHAMAVSARGFQGMGPVFRVDNTVDRNRQAQALPGQFLREVTVFENGGGIRPGEHSALQVLCDELLEDRAGDAHLMDDSSNIFLGVAPTAAELVNFRPGSGSEGAEEAKGVPPMGVVMASGGIIGLDDDVTPGQFARFLRTTPQLVLDDTEAIYRSCKQRMEREGSTVLSSIHFTCSVRPDRVEQRQRGADGEVAVEACVMALHQQEVVRFCKTLKAPAAGVFCDGELGPAATLVGGILPKRAEAVMQGYASCAAVLCWNPSASEPIRHDENS